MCVWMGLPRTLHISPDLFAFYLFFFISLSRHSVSHLFVLKLDFSSELSGRRCRCEEGRVSVDAFISPLFISPIYSFSVALCTALVFINFIIAADELKEMSAKTSH